MPRDKLFDLAVNRALRYAQRLDIPVDDAEGLRSGLELWYLKTRFAYRIPLNEVVAALQTYPGQGSSWQGGKTGTWHEKNA